MPSCKDIFSNSDIYCFFGCLEIQFSSMEEKKNTIEDFKDLTSEKKKERRLQLFWDNVDILLAKKNCTLRDVAEKTGLKYQTILGWRTNNRLPDLSAAIDMAKCLGVLVENLTEPGEYGGISVQDLVKDAAAFVPQALQTDDKFLDTLNRVKEAADMMDGILSDMRNSSEWVKIGDTE